MTMWSGLWNGFYNIPYSALGNNGNTADYNKTKWTQLAKLTRGPAGRRMGTLIRTLTGQAPGALAQSFVYQVPSRPDPTAAYTGGGYVRAVQKFDINRNTTPADEAWIDAATLLKSSPPVYPVDKGGGGARTPGIF